MRRPVLGKLNKKQLELNSNVDFKSLNKAINKIADQSDKYFFF